MSIGDRRERLLPDGVTAERYAAVFTGILSRKKPGERLRKEVSFSELTAGCRRLVLEVHRELWGL